MYLLLVLFVHFLCNLEMDYSSLASIAQSESSYQKHEKAHKSWINERINDRLLTD